MVLFIVNFDLAESRRCLIIFSAENTSSRLLIFLDFDHKQQESVQNWFNSTQFKFNLCSMLGLLEYLFICTNMQFQLMFWISYLRLVSLACICIIFVEICNKLVHISLRWWLYMVIGNEKSDGDVQGCANKIRKTNNVVTIEKWL